MALIKAFIVIAAVGVLLWRFDHPIGCGPATMYLVGMGLAPGATALIWELTFIGWAALIFHAGGFTLLFTAFADRKGFATAKFHQTPTDRPPPGRGSL